MKVYYWPPGSNWRNATCTVSEFELAEMERNIRQTERWLRTHEVKNDPIPNPTQSPR